MSIRVECPDCGRCAEVHPDQAGERVTCFHCARSFVLPDMVVCPDCGHAARAQRGRPGYFCNHCYRALSAVGELPPPGPLADRTRPRPHHPRLTAPHVCMRCRQPIRAASEPGFGLRRATVPHESGGSEPHTTDIYAAIYFCPCCPSEQALESPKAQWGQPATCPACLATFPTPNDDVLREVDPDQVDGRRFSFRCPACDGELACNVRHAGTAVVCLYCHIAITVPRSGEPVAARVGTTAPRSRAPAPRPPRPVGHSPLGVVRCPRCNTALQ